MLESLRSAAAAAVADTGDVATRTGTLGAQRERAVELLRSVGQRVTTPRVVVLSHVLAAGSQHLSADELLERVAAADAGVHRATVYRTLEGLTEAGLLVHVHLGRGLTAYHLAGPEHAEHGGHLHAQCSQCGRVVDLPADVLGDTAERIRAARGFRLDAAHVALSGLCRDCAG
jgi:Fur family ferric uptake transcriptional regulator